MKITEEELGKAFRSLHVGALKSMSLPVRVNSIWQMTEKGLSEATIAEKDINWDMVNDLLFADKDVHLFNVIEQVNNIEDLSSLWFHLIQASTGDLAPWRKETCKSCREVFYLYWGEIEYFLRHNLYLPKRCKLCRDKRREEINV